MDPDYNPRRQADRQIDQAEDIEQVDQPGQANQASEPVAVTGGSSARPFSFNRRAFLITAAIILALAVVGGLALFLNSRDNGQDGEKAENYAVGDLEVDDQDKASLSSPDNLTVNGRLEVAQTLVIEPTSTPNNPTAGQIYYDRAANSPYYYNGQQFVNLSTTVNGVGGNLTLGDGLQLAGTQLSLGPAILQAQGARVTSFQGQDGAVTLTAGPGIAINGTTISNTAITSLPQDLSTSGSPTFAGLSLGNALGLGSGGTNANGSAYLSGGVFYFDGNGFVTTAAAGAPGQCLLSTASGPEFGACPGGGAGVNQIQGSSGVAASGNISINNASTTANTITINDATTDAKGIASFNSGDFSVSGGAVSLGTVGVAKGGTGLTGTPTNGQLLIGNGSGYTLATLTAGAGVNITNGSGTITIAAPGSGTCTDCASKALDNLDAVAINTSLLPASTNTIDLGATGNRFKDLYLQGNAAVTGSVTAGSLAGAGSGVTALNAGNVASGTLATARGGTGLDGSTAGNGQLLIGTGTGYALATLTAGTGVTITNGSGSIQIAAAGAGSCATCANLTLSNLTSPTAINQNLLPDTHNTRDIGATGTRFKDLYLQGNAAIAGDLGTANLSTGGTARLSNTGLLQNVFLGQAGGTGGAGALVTGTTGAISLATTSSSGECLISNGANSAPTWGDCNGGGGGGVTELNSQTGSIDLTSDGSVGIDASTPGQIILTVAGAGSCATCANLTLSNLTSPTAINQHLLPGATNTYDLGATANRWKDLFLQGSATIAGNLSAANVSGNGSGLTDLDAGDISAGTLAVARGGTGVDGSAATNGQLLIGNGSGYSLATLTAGTGVTITNGSGTIQIAAAGAGTCSTCANQTLGNLTSPTAVNQALLPDAHNTRDIGATGTRWKDLYLQGNAAIAGSVTANTLVGDGSGLTNLDAGDISTGTLAVARGGTGVDGSAATNGQLLIGTGSGYALATLTAGSGISITNGSGSIQIAASGGGGVSSLNGNTGSVTVQGTTNQITVTGNAVNPIVLSLPSTTATATFNGTTGINTGATLGTQRIDASGNLVNIGTIGASGNINTSGGALQTAGTTRISSAGVLGNVSMGSVAGALVTTNGGTIAVAAASTTDDLCLMTNGGTNTPSFQSCPGGTAGAFLNGGNSFGGGAVLGTNDAEMLSFETSGSNRMTIDSSGFTAIGTSVDPSFRLNVGGQVKATSLLINGAASVNGSLTISDESGYKNIQAYDGEPLSINSAGNNVCIGATSCSSKLTVTGNIAVTSLGSADTSTTVCRNTSNQLATCSSSKNYKHNIQALQNHEYADILDKVKNTDIYRYNFKGNPNDYTHTGVISEYLPAELAQDRDQNGNLIPDWFSVYGYLWAGERALANKVEALEAMQQQAINQGMAANLKSLKVEGRAVVGTLEVKGDARVGGNIRVDGDAKVDGNAEVKGDLAVDGSLQLGAASKGINVKVKQGDKKLTVRFAKPQKNDKYMVQIQKSWLGDEAVIEKTAKGFTIEFAAPVPKDAKLDWLLAR